jgi:uncharacterized repeat protein (TIGR01451 family)
MPSFGDLVGQSGHWWRLIRWTGKYRFRRFWTVVLFSFLATCLLSGGPFLRESWSPPVAHAQLPSTITNQASGGFDGATAPVQSNTTTVNLASTTAGGLTIVKTADRGAAEPGDIVVYRLLVSNSGSAAITNLTVADQLPFGMQLIANSFRTAPIAATSTSVQGNSFSLQFASLAGNQSLEIVYAAVVTPDAVRGSGRNTAVAGAPGVGTVSSSFQLVIRPGILADCGTIVGRVFVDKNFDGHQQDGEPGVPNAVIYLDSGNRVLTDPDGLFSLINVLSGPHVGTLDLSSLPGYMLAPNLYWLADNSVSRLVRLEPGGLARMNFAVTPTFGEGQSE